MLGVWAMPSRCHPVFISPLTYGLPEVKVMPKQTPNPVMARTASRLTAATMRVGIPLSSPYPRSDSPSMLGTTTAGDTTDSTKLPSEQKVGIRETSVDVRHKWALKRPAWT